MTLCHFAAALKARKPAEDKGSISKFLCTTLLSRGGDWNSLRRSICKQLLKRCPVYNIVISVERETEAKTFRSPVFPHLNFSITTEASHFSVQLFHPCEGRGEQPTPSDRVVWDTNSRWKELVLLYSWTVTTLHGDSLLDTCPSWESQPCTRTTP